MPRASLPSIALICLATNLAAADAGLFDTGWSDDFATVDAWTAQPSWLANASAQARVTTDGQAACFHVPEAGRGMKWRRYVSDLWLGGAPYLLIRYRAQGMAIGSADYFLYVDDRGPKQTNAIRLKDVVADGQWHTVGVNLKRIAQSDAIRAVAIQVQAAQGGPARVWVSDLRFCERLPEGCTELRAAAQPKLQPAWWADLDAANWEPQPAWLPNPAARHSVRRTDGVTTFALNQPTAGMKWSWFFDAQVPIATRRYIAMRYRATGTRAAGDYAMCVLANANPDGRSYEKILAPRDLRHDGRWHTLTLPIDSVAASFDKIKGLAIQAQSANENSATLEVAKLGFVNTIEPEPASDFLSGAPGGDFAGWESVPLPGVGVELGRVLAEMNVEGWPDGQTVTIERAPFALPRTSQAVPITGLVAKAEAAIGIGRPCSQVLLLTIAALRGQEEQVYGRSVGISAIREIDRFRLRLEYADGSTEECFPYNATQRGFVVGEGAQVLCAFADPTKPLARAVVCDHTDRAAFVVVAATARTSGGRLFADMAEEWPAWRPKPLPAPTGSSGIERRGERLVIAAPPTAAELSLAPLPKWVSLRNSAAGDELFKRGPSEWLFEVNVDGKPVPPEQFKLTACEVEPGRAAKLTYESAAPRVRLRVRIGLGDAGEIAFDASVENLGDKPVRLGMAGPRVAAFQLGDDLADNHYAYPKRGWHFGNRPVSLRTRYGGYFPLQFMAAFSPAAGSGLYIRTEDVAGVMRDYLLSKAEAGMGLWLDYPAQEVAPGGQLAAARTLVAAASGDWHDAFDAYVKWVKTWHQPLQPRQQWYREVFNFRQRFLRSHDPLYDAKAGKLQLGRALDEAEEHFGGMEYLHLFDWGYCGKYGRIYGRTGDYSPYDYITGGHDALRAAIAGVQRRGVRVGLYIEGYLLQEKGKLGQAHGKEWQLIDRKGQGRYWPGGTEMFMCPLAPAWQEVQASTYATKVAELDVDGMYLDQFGFAGPGKDCWSPDHGHPVPGYSMMGERVLSTKVRQRIQTVKPGVVMYGEEAPCDVSSQVIDGGFTYHMACCRRSMPLAPIHPVRFAIPSFKTFEILVCDRPMGSWAEGVKWTFFNGEGIWLEGPAIEWFQPQTLAAIRKCHAILRTHKDAFTSDAPVPLVPTEMGGVYANLFPTERKAVYTLYNSRHRSVRGPVLAITARPGARYVDAWNGQPITPKRRGDADVIALTIGPRDVGCVVVKRDP